MDHEALKERIFLSRDRALSPADQKEAALHLAQCRECREALDAWDKTSSLLFPAAKIESPALFVERVMDRIENAPARGPVLADAWRAFAAELKAALAPRRLVLAGTALAALSAVFIARPWPARPPSSAAAIEYASDLMEGPFAYVDNETSDGETAIEEYFL